MKLIYITLFFFSIVLLRAANPSADNRPQEKLSYQSIFNQIIATPEKAITLADSAENLRIIPEYKAHIIRSRAYARLKNEKKALEYALAAFHTDSVQNDSTAYMNVCQILSNCYIELSRQNEAIEYATKAIQIARSQGNKSVEATSMIPSHGHKTSWHKKTRLSRHLTKRLNCYKAPPIRKKSVR